MCNAIKKFTITAVCNKKGPHKVHKVHVCHDEWWFNWGRKIPKDKKVKP